MSLYPWQTAAVQPVVRPPAPAPAPAPTPWTAPQPVLRPAGAYPTGISGTTISYGNGTTTQAGQVGIPTQAGFGNSFAPTGAVPFNGPTPVLKAGAPPSGGGYTDLRTQTIGGPSLGGSISAPRLGGSISAPAAGPAIAAQNAQPTLDALQKALAGSVSPEAQRLRQMAMTSLGGLSSAPDRAQLAAQALQLQREMTQPAWQQDLRQTGALAAALGRTGSGMTTNELTGLTLARERSLGQYGQQAALEAAGQTMADRLGIFDRTAGLEGQFRGEDMSRAGFARDIANNKFDIGTTVRGQRVGERDYASDQAWRRTGLQVDQQGRADTNAWRGTDLALNQQGRGDTNAWRGVDLRLNQQSRQDQQAQQGINNAMTQKQLEDQLLDSAFRRQLAAGTAAGGYGYGGTPYGTQMDASQQMGNQAAAGMTAAQQAAQAEAMRRYMAY